VWIDSNGKANWSSTAKDATELNGYQVYAEEAGKIGLFPGGHWISFKDWPLWSSVGAAWGEVFPYFPAHLNRSNDYRW
jgi:hypothetical protein